MPATGSSVGLFAQLVPAVLGASVFAATDGFGFFDPSTSGGQFTLLPVFAVLAFAGHRLDGLLCVLAPVGVHSRRAANLRFGEHQHHSAALHLVELQQTVTHTSLRVACWPQDHSIYLPAFAPGLPRALGVEVQVFACW